MVLKLTQSFCEQTIRQQPLPSNHIILALRRRRFFLGSEEPWHVPIRPPLIRLFLEVLTKSASSVKGRKKHCIASLAIFASV